MRAMVARLSRLTVAFLAAGCSTELRDIGQAPHLTPVGSGLQAPPALHYSSFPPVPRQASLSLWDDGRSNLFRDASAKRVGDLVTINILINDKAQLGNSSDRSKEAKVKNTFDFVASLFGASPAGSSALNIESTSSSKGSGNIDRSEKIQFTIAAVVTDVLPNGNLVINGSQEFRVNFELRQIEIGGIVRPNDITRENTVAYDKIAEARISYGGRGRQSEVQQPNVVHQLYDIATPF